MISDGRCHPLCSRYNRNILDMPVTELKKKIFLHKQRTKKSATSDMILIPLFVFISLMIIIILYIIAKKGRFVSCHFYSCSSLSSFSMCTYTK